LSTAGLLVVISPVGDTAHELVEMVSLALNTLSASQSNDQSKIEPGDFI
jgi:hypothetical protein